MNRGLATFHLPVNVSPLLTPHLLLPLSRERSFLFSLVCSPPIASHILVLNVSPFSCVLVFLCLFLCVRRSLFLCGAEECVRCRSSVREMWGECRQVWGIACESDSAYRSD